MKTKRKMYLRELRKGEVIKATDLAYVRPLGTCLEGGSIVKVNWITDLKLAPLHPGNRYLIEDGPGTTGCQNHTFRLVPRPVVKPKPRFRVVQHGKNFGALDGWMGVVAPFPSLEVTQFACSNCNKKHDLFNDYGIISVKHFNKRV